MRTTVLKAIALAVMSFLMALTIDAQDSFYYYHGNKVPLKVHETRIVSITPKLEISFLSLSDGLTLVNDISDARADIKVYEITSADKKYILANEYFPCYQSSDGKELIPNGYINVKLKKSTDYSLLVSKVKQYNCEIEEQNSFMPLWYSIRVIPGKGGNSVSIANALYETGLFASCFPSFSIDATEISYDTNVHEQWGLYNSNYEDFDISISEAWNYSTGRGIKIAIVDCGVELTHIDLVDNIYQMSYDTESETSPSKTYGDHGTHCAGIAAAVRNNGIQVAGVAPDSKIMSVSTILSFSNNVETKLADGINWAWMNKADVISCSWRCGKNEMIEEAINNSVSLGRDGKGCVFVKSAGNSGGAITYPGDYSENVIAVANMTEDGSLSSDSSYGPNLFVTAPGTGILSTVLNNRIKKYGGTSMACPHVAGLAALILERNPSLTAVQVREIIGKNTKKVGKYPYSKEKVYGSWNERYGYGLIDAYKAVINTPRK